MEITPRSDLAVEFLRRWTPEGPWVLSAAKADRSKMDTRTFHAEEAGEMLSWIESFQGKRNIYYIVNPVRHPMNIKPRRIDIAAIIALHVDIDPRAGEDFQKERERILNSLVNFEPHPTVIVNSGAGYQAFWKLQEPIPLDGTEANAIEQEGYSQQLELVLHGDRTSNADRLMRLPGTINIPNEVKIRKGRVAALAEVVEYNDFVYPLSAFVKSPTRIQSNLASMNKDQLSGVGGEKVVISGNLTPLYIEDLSKKNVTVPDNIKVLIVQGDDPDNPGKYPSRSEALWAVVCALVRAGATDDDIAGIILNRDNAISASVLDKPRAERYAAKQIQDAREEAENPKLRELNAKHAVISDHGGKCRIISEVYDYSLNRPRISQQTFSDFTNRYRNLKVEVAQDKDGKPVLKQLGVWWIDHPQRRQYDTIIFAPGREHPKAYNLWQGFACQPLPGDCSLFLEHILENICAGNQKYYDYILGWMARCVQQPDCPGEVAIVLRGEMGTGKGAFAKHFGSLFGRHFLQISDSKHLVGNFNSHLRDCVVLLGDEAFYAGDKKHESVLKSLVTEETLSIEAKGVDLVASPNYTHLILASNSNWVVPAGSNERRFFVLDVSAKRMQDKRYFNAIREQMNRGGREALLHMLMHYNLTEYEVRDVPKTEGLQDQKLLSQSPEELWYFEKLEEGRLLRNQDSWETEIAKNELQEDYILFMQRIGVMRKASSTVLGKFLGRVCPGGVPRTYQRMAKVHSLGSFGEAITTTRRVYFYEFPTLEKCREFWDKHHGGPFDWNPPLDKGEQVTFQEEKEPFR